METSDHPSSSSPSPSIFSVPEWDWDQPMTQQQLEELDAIESAFRSQTSSSTPTSQEADDRRKIRRRLPNSIGSNRCPSAFKGRDLNSFSLSPCPTSRFLNLFHSPCQEIGMSSEAWAYGLCLQLYGAVGRFLNGLGLSIGEWTRISIWKDIGCGTWNSNFKKAWVWGHVG
ncbi:hypothetical protein CK203_098025 [Vitis vinifera]|uniref:Uncharacterized protein n=1 Tax=Vitis vinifera TaxID=29760 RepID=A0A438CKN8_VITVI|nr:hypothetical protein CK203_098025 [Vitis vinifera]